MPGPSKRFDKLARQFEALMESLNEKTKLEKSVANYCKRMRLLINEIDGLDLSGFGLGQGRRYSHPRSTRRGILIICPLGI